jgi:hypothetical protein
MQNTMFLIQDYINRGTLLPSFLLNEKEVYDVIKKSEKYQLPTIKEWEDALSYLDISSDNLYLSTNPFSPFVYIKDFTYIDIQNLDIEFMKTFKVKETIIDITKEIDSLRTEQDYETIVQLTSNKYVLNVFHDAYEEIPVEQKYKVFRATYTQMEYGFQAFKPEILEEVLTMNNDTSFKEELKVDKEGYVTVYRGEGSKSRGIEEAYSWSTEERVAKFFAYRFDKKGKIYQGKVHIDDIVDFIDDRNESEILVIPENVKDIVEI